MMQRKFFIQEKNPVIQPKLKKGVGKAKSSTWQCVNQQRQREQRFESGGEQGTAALVPLYPRQVVTREQKSERAN